MALPFVPAAGFMLCEEVKSETTKAGIIITQSEEEGEPVKAIVLKVAQGELMDNGQRREVPVKAGDVCYLLLPRYSRSTRISFDDVKKRYLVVESKYVVGTVPD